MPSFLSLFISLLLTPPPLFHSSSPLFPSLSPFLSFSASIFSLLISLSLTPHLLILSSHLPSHALLSLPFSSSSPFLSLAISHPFTSDLPFLISHQFTSSSSPPLPSYHFSFLFHASLLTCYLPFPSFLLFHYTSFPFLHLHLSLLYLILPLSPSSFSF